MSPNEHRIRQACQRLGVPIVSLRWEPVSAGLEMAGPSGGWLLNDCDPIGLSTDEAIQNLADRQKSAPLAP